MTARELEKKVEDLLKEDLIEDLLEVLLGEVKNARLREAVVDHAGFLADIKRRAGLDTISQSTAIEERSRCRVGIHELAKNIIRSIENQGYYSSEKENRAGNQDANVMPTRSLLASPEAGRPVIANDAYTIASSYGFVQAAESQPRQAGREPLALLDRVQFTERKQLEETVHLLQELMIFLPAGEREKRRIYGQKLSETQRQLNLLIQVTGQLTDLISRAATKTDRLEKIEDLLKKGNLQKVDSILDTDRLKQQQVIFLQQREQGQAVLSKTEQDLKDLAFEFLLKAKLLSMLQPDATVTEEVINSYEESLRAFPQTDTSIAFARFLHAQGNSDRAKQVLNDAIQQPGSALSREDMVRLQYGLAFLSDYTNEQDKAKQYYETAIKVGGQILKDKPDNAKMLAEILLDYAIFYRKQRNYPTAMQCYRQSLQIWEEASEHTPRDKRFEAIILFETGSCQQEQEQYTRALQHYRKSLKLLNQIAEKNPADVEPELMAEVLVRLGFLQSAKQDPKQGLTHLNQALDIYRKLYAEDTAAYSAGLARVLQNIGFTYFKLEHIGPALEHYTESLQVWRKMSEEAPKQYRGDVANILYDIANTYQTAGEIIPAKTAYRESLDLFNALDKENPKVFLTSRAAVAHDLGRLLHRQKAYTEAIDTYLDSLEPYREIAVQDPDVYQPGLALLLWDLGVSYADNGNLDEAEAAYTESLALYEKLAGKRPEEFAGVSGHLSNILGIVSEQNSKFEQAGQYFQKAVDIYRQLNAKYPNTYTSDLAGTTNNLAMYNQNVKHDYAESERLYMLALNLLRDAALQDTKYNTDIANVMKNMASLSLLQWQTTKDPIYKEKALAQCAETQTLLEKFAGPDADLNGIKQSLEEMKRQFI